MKLKAQNGGETHEVEITRDGARLVAEVDGRRYALEVSEPEPNVYLFKHDGRVHEFYVAPPKEPGGATVVSAASSDIEVTIIDPKRLRTAGTGDEFGDGNAEIRTAMPGKVVRILRSAGEEVAKGEGVIVVEAMKMQNEIKSPTAGVVTEVRAAEGDTVGAGDVLVVIG